MKRTLIMSFLLFPLSATAVDHRMVLEELVVQGTALEETLPSELADYGAELEVIDSDQLDRTGVTDVGQALQGSVPGLFLSPKTGRGDYVDISIQGSRTQDVLWLVDGVRINNRLFGSTTPLDSISTQMIERIEVLKGGQGLFYGTQAVAGVVNIVLRQPTEEPSGNLTIGAGSLGDRRIASHASGQSGLGRWLVFGEHDSSDGYRPYRDEAYQANARRVDRGFNRQSVGGRYLIDAGQGKSLNTLVIRNDAKADFSRQANNFKSVNDRDEHIVSAKWDHQVTEQTGYFLKAYYHDWWTDYTRLGMDTNGTVNVINDRDEWGFEDYGLNLTARHVLPSGSEILGGIDYQRYHGEDFVLRIDGQAESVTAGFVQYRPHLDFSPSTNLALGARYNHADFGGDHAIWNISLGQPLTPDLELSASAGTNFRLPSAFELFVIDEAFPAGNEDLEPEKSLDTNLALSGRIARSAVWRLGAFYREIDDLIKTEDGTYVNSDNAVRVRGGELGIEFGGDQGWRLAVNATYARARERGGDAQIDDIPEWFANATLGWDGAAYGGDLNARYTGDTATTLADLGRQEHGNHTVIDASAWYEFGRGGENRITARLENVTDRRYATGVSQGTTPEDAPFRYETLGAPRNVQLEYSRSF